MSTPPSARENFIKELTFTINTIHDEWNAESDQTSITVETPSGTFELVVVYGGGPEGSSSRQLGDELDFVVALPGGKVVTYCHNCGARTDRPPRGPCAAHGTEYATYD